MGSTLKYWDGCMWVLFDKPIDSIIIDITEPGLEDPETVMEFSLGTEP